MNANETKVDLLGVLRLENAKRAERRAHLRRRTARSPQRTPQRKAPGKGLCEMSAPKFTKGDLDRASRSMAHLYVWDAIVAILCGSTDPGRECPAAGRAVDRVLKICEQEKNRCLANYDRQIDSSTAAIAKARGEA